MFCLFTDFLYFCNQNKALKEWHSGNLDLTAAFGVLLVYIIYRIEIVFYYYASIIPMLDFLGNI